MITSKAQLREYLLQDAKANYRMTQKVNPQENYIWKFIKCIRHLDYYHYKLKKEKNIFCAIPFVYYRLWYFKHSPILGFSIPYTTKIGKGFAMPHYGTIVINGTTVIGENCKIHAGVNIGATNGEKNAAVIGNNVYIGPGAKIVGNITISDDVAIGAGAVVVKSIEEPGTTWGGVPAKKISDKDSHIHLCNAIWE